MRPSTVASAYPLRSVRALVLAVSTLVALALALPPARAATVTLFNEKDGQAWFWSTNREFRQCSPTIELPPPVGNASYCGNADMSSTAPISPGHLGVGLKNGNSDMRTYIQFDLEPIDFGSTIDSFRLDLHLSKKSTAENPDAAHDAEHNSSTTPGSKAPATSDAAALANAKIDACLVTTPWGPAEGAPTHRADNENTTKTEPIEPFVMNGIDCSVKVEGKPGATWTFDLTEMATRWVAGTTFNVGVVLLPRPTGTATDSWVVEFHGAEFDKAVSDAQGNTRRVRYVRKAEASRARVTFQPPAPEPIDEPTDEPTPFEPPPIGPTGPSFTPPPEPEPTPTLSPERTPLPQRPVAESTPITPWYAWVSLSLGLTAFFGLSRAIGREAGTAGGNHVAEMLRRRREGDGPSGE